MTSLATDTICAAATASGVGGIGVVRISGPQALAIGEAICGGALRARHAHLREFRDAEGRLIDQGIALAFPGPGSFTGEDVVELQGHGGLWAVRNLLSAALARGAREARPGEFSERAFLNERLDLAQAEAIADLVEAGTETAARAAARSMRGDFSRQVRDCMDRVIELRIWVEAALDFPDEDVDFLVDPQIGERLEVARDAIATLLASARRGARLAAGANLVLVGRPNAGKSSLLNRLARVDAAIVTEIPGTTRDVIRVDVDVAGVPVRLVDTAGLRESGDVIEQEGMRRAREEIEMADGLLYLIDVSDPEITEPVNRESLAETVGAALPEFVFLVQNKIDLPSALPRALAGPGLSEVHVSAKTGEGVDRLLELLAEAFSAASPETEVSARSRHVDALQRADATLARAAAMLARQPSGDLLAEDLRQAGDALGEILGVVTPDDLLGRIFSSFCIGK